MASIQRANGIFKIAADVPMGGFAVDVNDEEIGYLRLDNVENYEVQANGRVVFARVGDGAIVCLAPNKEMIYYPLSEVVLK